MKKIELLAPAGDLEKLKVDVLYGADAVYIGGKAFSLRAGATNFTKEDMIEGVKFAHDHGVKVHVTFNIYPNDEKNKLSAKTIKTKLIKAINKHAKDFEYSPPEDSARVITIKVKDVESSKIKHSVDFAIVNNYIDDKGCECQEYIKFNKKSNQYEWQKQDDGFYEFDEKIEWIKDEDLWNELRDMYLFRKNNNNDKNKHSRSLFVEAVNNICNEYGYYD